MKLTIMLVALVAMLTLNGCASTHSAIIAYNTGKNLRQVDVRADVQQQAVNVLRNYNKSRGGF